MAPAVPIGLTIVSREEWGAAPSKNSKPTPVKTPVAEVRYGFTSTARCHTREECCEILQEYQMKYMNKGQDDQPFNFFVGGDGAIYEGRGWKEEADRPSRLKKLKGKCVDIAYIGDFHGELPPTKMVDAASDFIMNEIDDNKIEDMPKIHTLHNFMD